MKKSIGDEELRKIVQDEQSLYQYKIHGISIWSFVRRAFRMKRLLRNCGIQPLSTHSSFHFVRLICCFFQSLFQIVRFIFSKKQVDTFFFNFARLDCVEGVWLDRFCDPIISEVGIDNYICFERGNSGYHKKPRLHKQSVVYVEAIDFICLWLSYIYSPFSFLFHRSVFYSLFKEAKDSFHLDKHDLVTIVFFFNRLNIKRAVYKSLFRMKKPKCVFGVARSTFLPQIAACKQLGIQVCELQHGITFSETIVYSGCVDKMFVPDCFLAFGSMWNGSQFGIDPHNIINIGWAFSDYLRKKIQDVSFLQNHILVISEPQISDKIIEIVKALSIAYPSYHFDIRLHPMERFDDKQMSIIDAIPNAHVVDNKISSFVAIMQYQYVIGEHSTVLYEALSMGRKVAKICFGGLSPKSLTENYDDGFLYVHDIKEFGVFLSVDNNSQDEGKSDAYSPFDKQMFSRIIHCESLN